MNTSLASRFPCTAGPWTPITIRPRPGIGSITITLANRISSGRSPGTRRQIQGWELTLRSPNLWHRGQLHLAYANQIAQATSPITGGLICPPVTPSCGLDIPPGFSPVDHDQRNTLNVGYNSSLPWQSYASTNLYYGSGFTNGLPGAHYPGNYLPATRAVDLSLGKTFAENYSFSLTALNVGDRRVQLDNSLTFGGFHWDDPRQIYVEFRYRFHY